MWLEREAMAVPAKNLAVRKPITASLAGMMGFPTATSASAAICQNKLLATANVTMTVRLSPTLAPFASSFPRLCNCFIRERHDRLTPFCRMSGHR